MSCIQGCREVFHNDYKLTQPSPLKCLPLGRDWNRGEKCDACTKGNQPCGPNERFTTPANNALLARQDPEVLRPIASARIPGPQIQSAGELLMNQHTLQFASQLPACYPAPTQLRYDGPVVAFPRTTAHLPHADAEVLMPSYLELHDQDDNHAIADAPGFHDAMDLATASNSNLNGWLPPGLDQTEAEIRETGGNVSQRNSEAACRTTLKKLDALHELYEYFQDWRKALPQDFKAIDNDKTFETYSSALDFICLAIESGFRLSLKDLLEQLQGSPIATEERDLRRALDVIHLFEDTARRKGIVNQPHKVHAAILRRLIAISQSRDEVIQVKRLAAEHRHLYRLEQGDGEPGLDQPLADVFQKSAETAWTTLQDLSIDNRVMNSLHMNEHFSLPVAHKAMHVGLHEVASILPRTKADESHFSDGLLRRSFFHIAVDRNDIDLLRFLVQHHAEHLDDMDVFNRTALLIAASKGNLPAFECLAHAGANILRRDLGARSILNHACASGNAQMVKYLLERGLEVNDRIFGRSSPFKEAAARGHFEICSLILAHGVSHGEMVDASMEAATKGHDRVVELIHGKLHEGFAAAGFLDDTLHSMRSTPDSFSQFVNYEASNLIPLDRVAAPSMSACISTSSSSASGSDYPMSEPVYDASSQRSDSPGSQSYTGS